MVRMTVTYKGELRCEAEHGPSGYRIETDAPADNHGRAERFSPTDLLGVSLASCMATTMSIKGRPHGWRLEGMKVQVEKYMSSEGPRRMVRLPVTLIMPSDFPAGDRALAEEIAATCPARISLHPAIEVPVTFIW